MQFLIKGKLRVWKETQDRLISLLKNDFAQKVTILPEGVFLKVVVWEDAKVFQSSKVFHIDFLIFISHLNCAHQILSNLTNIHKAISNFTNIHRVFSKLLLLQTALKTFLTSNKGFFVYCERNGWLMSHVMRGLFIVCLKIICILQEDLLSESCDCWNSMHFSFLPPFFIFLLYSEYKKYFYSFFGNLVHPLWTERKGMKRVQSKFIFCNLHLAFWSRYNTYNTRDANCTALVINFSSSFTCKPCPQDMKIIQTFLF